MPSKMLKLKVFHYVFLFSPKYPKTAICHRFVGKELCIYGDRPRHSIVYIPKADQ